MTCQNSFVLQSPLFKSRPPSEPSSYSPKPALFTCDSPPAMEEMVLVSNLPSLYYRPIMHPISAHDLEQLRAMRIASGWYYERIPSWLNEIASGQRLMWFIYLSDPMSQVLATAAGPMPTWNQQPRSPYAHYFDSGSSSSSSPTPHNYGMHSATASTSSTTPAIHPPVGMVCLSLSNAQDPSLASFSLSGRVEICSLFVYAAYRNLGVGAAAMRNMEERARTMGAIVVTLNTPAVERPLRKYLSMGYREYKPRSRVYSADDIRDAGLTEDYEVAAFLEKSLI